MKISSKIIFILSLSILLNACIVGPNYKSPEVLVPKHFKEAKGKAFIGKKSKEWKIAQPRDTEICGNWWALFQDDTLNALEDTLQKRNFTLKNAYENYMQAKAQVDAARAAFFPTLTYSALVTRSRSATNTNANGVAVNTTPTGTNTIIGSSANSSNGSNINSLHSDILNATWELDIWGQVHRMVEAAKANAENLKALYAATQLSSQASLAQYYFELRGLDNDQKLLNDTVLAYRKSLQITTNQYASGTASRAQVLQAQSLLEQAQASSINNGILRQQYEHAIAVLIGVPPAQFSLRARNYALTPPIIPVSIPSEMLERRPDVAAAERLMAKANAEVGIAVAACYPTLQLTGLLSASGPGFTNLLNLPTLGWAYGAQLAGVFFDGGLRIANIHAAQHGFYATVATYRQTVLSAFQDVEDNLVALRLLSEQSVIQHQAANTATHSLQLTINEYKSGTVDYTSVVVAQVNAYNAEKSAVDVDYLRMTAAVGLIKALGGGWNGDMS